MPPPLASRAGPELPAGAQIQGNYRPGGLMPDAQGWELPLTLASLGGLGGAALAQNTGSPVRDSLRGGSKGLATAAGGYLASQAVPEHPFLAGGAGAVGSWLAADRLLDYLGLNESEEETPPPNKKRPPAKKAEAAFTEFTPDFLGSSGPEVSATPSPVLQALLEAKAESDRGNYPAKHAILRRLLQERPDEFVIDSSQGKFLGLTHQPTRFRMHLPRTSLPAGTPAKKASRERGLSLPQIKAAAGLSSLLGTLGRGAMSAGRTMGTVGGAGLRGLSSAAQGLWNPLAKGNRMNTAAMSALIPGYAPAMAATQLARGAGKIGKGIWNASDPISKGAIGLTGLGGATIGVDMLRKNPEAPGAALSQVPGALQEMGRQHYGAIGQGLGNLLTPGGQGGGADPSLWINHPAVGNAQEGLSAGMQGLGTGLKNLGEMGQTAAGEARKGFPGPFVSPPANKSSSARLGRLCARTRLRPSA